MFFHMLILGKYSHLESNAPEMTSPKEDNPDLSIMSPADDSDTILSPVAEPEPNPGLDGMPVRCE